MSWGYETHVGYFPQDHRELLLDPETTPLALMDEALPLDGPSVVRGQLGRMLFSGDDVNKPVAALSGGEAARLVFCRIMAQKPNVLVLDEPTNHLDLESIVALGDALEKYEGTAFVVTHDRDLVATFATRIFSFTDNGLVDWQGNYDDYVERFGGDDGPEKGGTEKSEREAEASA